MMGHGLDASRCWFVDIPYSTNYEVNNAIKALGCPDGQMVRPFNDPISPYSRRQRERVEYMMRLLAEQEEKKPLLVIDDGAYFVRTLSHLMQTDGKLVASFKDRGTYVVEQTTRGHRYLQHEAGSTVLEALNFPVVSIARSQAKYRLESPFIGAAVYRALSNVLEQRGRISDKLASTSPEERQRVLRDLETRVQMNRELVSVSVGLPPMLVDSYNNTRGLLTDSTFRFTREHAFAR